MIILGYRTEMITPMPVFASSALSRHYTSKQVILVCVYLACSLWRKVGFLI